MHGSAVVFPAVLAFAQHKALSGLDLLKSFIIGLEIEFAVAKALTNKIYDKGILYKYIAGKYNSLTDAEFRKSEVAQNGFTDAFIYAEKDGERIPVKQALRLLNK